MSGSRRKAIKKALAIALGRPPLKARWNGRRWTQHDELRATKRRLRRR